MPEYWTFLHLYSNSTDSHQLSLNIAESHSQGTFLNLCPETMYISPNHCKLGSVDLGHQSVLVYKYFIPPQLSVMLTDEKMETRTQYLLILFEWQSSSFISLILNIFILSHIIPTLL